jgi:hypothetical protein
MPFEAGESIASQTATTPATLRTLGDQVRSYRDRCAELRPGDDVDVCFVRTNPRWTHDEHQAVDQLGAMEDMGVTWIETGSAGRSVDEVLEDLQRVVAVAGAAGVRRATDGATP